MNADPPRLAAIDLGAVGVVSLAIALAADRLVLMTVLVPLVIVARFALLARERVALGPEIAFFALCTVLGAFNDWNSVCRHQIYDYTVPHFFAFTTIPLWMLLFWGMILRLVARVARWRALDPPDEPVDRVRIGPLTLDDGWSKVALELALVLATRQMVYRFFAHPILSWLPFAAALVLWVALLRPTRYDWRLAGVALAFGPLVEVLYIQAGGLHRYHLGWFAGVPLWIVCWWVLAIPIWADLSLRIQRRLPRLIPLIAGRRETA